MDSTTIGPSPPTMTPPTSTPTEVRRGFGPKECSRQWRSDIVLYFSNSFQMKAFFNHQTSFQNQIILVLKWYLSVKLSSLSAQIGALNHTIG
jgi:hypothetical protein